MSDSYDSYDSYEGTTDRRWVLQGNLPKGQDENDVDVVLEQEQI